MNQSWEYTYQLKGKKGAFPLAIALIAGGVFIFLFAIGASGGIPGTGNGDGGGSGGGSIDVRCDFVVKEGLISGASIQNEQCSITGTSRICFRTLGLFKQEGTAQLLDGRGNIDAKDFNTGFIGGEDEITLRGCTQENTATIRIEDEDGNLLDSVGVEFT